MRKRLKKILTVIRKHFGESLRAVAPITFIVVALCFTVAPISNGTFVSFVVGAALLVVGMSLFNIGAQTAMLPIGERIGTFVTNSRKLWLFILVPLLVGILVTVSEPDLHVLAEQLPGIPNMVLLLSVAVGVGLFLVIALLRLLFQLPLSWILLGLYIGVFGLAAFVPGDFVTIAFDAGGVTTGPMTVPFILALGFGVASIRSDEHSADDTFGLVALSSVGPILTVLLLGLFYPGGVGEYAPAALNTAENTREIWQEFTRTDSGFLHYAADVAVSLAPIALFFLIFQAAGLKMNRKAFGRIAAGMLYTFLGLVLFLTGVNVGFMPAGRFLGAGLAELPERWVLIPVAMLIGFFIVRAEPAVHVLNSQVEEITSGAIPAKAMNMALAIGLCASLGLAMLRLLTGLSIFWFLVPGYALALALSFFVPKIFTAIAFDSGGVASGPMTATFLLPFSIGACVALGGNPARDAFGVVAMVAMTPLLTIQIMGLLYRIRQKREADAETAVPPDAEIID
ncbi:MAG: DUF1538 domain-containing protein [Oscillospiraceae bacterium]|jgi:hypothetical protein|nr:DUF1538 domain-containing protein [Oscillospiraceae bacterium]